MTWSWCSSPTAGRVVWDFVSPRRFKGGQTVVRVPRALRLPPDYFTESFTKLLDAPKQSE